MTKAKKSTMKEQLISFETAKLAKEKGFDWGTLYAYDGSYSPMICSHSKNVFKLLDYNSPEGGHYHSAPTQSLLQKWLREKHKIIIWTGNWNGEYYECYKIKGKSRITKIISTPKDTYEEALEEGLKRALELI